MGEIIRKGLWGIGAHTAALIFTIGEPKPRLSISGPSPTQDRLKSILRYIERSLTINKVLPRTAQRGNPLTLLKIFQNLNFVETRPQVTDIKIKTGRCTALDQMGHKNATNAAHRMIKNNHIRNMQPSVLSEIDFVRNLFQDAA